MVRCCLGSKSYYGRLLCGIRSSRGQCDSRRRLGSCILRIPALDWTETLWDLENNQGLFLETNYSKLINHNKVRCCCSPWCITKNTPRICWLDNISSIISNPYSMHDFQVLNCLWHSQCWPSLRRHQLSIGHVGHILNMAEGVSHMMEALWHPSQTGTLCKLWDTLLW